MSTYPRTYRATPGWRLFLVGLSLVLGIPSLVGIWYFGSGHEVQTKSAIYVGVGVCLIFVALGVYLIITTLRSKIVLFADHIEIHELTVTHTFARDEIAGWRLSFNASPGVLNFELKGLPRRTVSTAWVYKADPEFDQWFAEVDNLDAREMESALDEIADDDNLGVDENERFERLGRSKRTARILNLLGGALFVWGTFVPRPYELVIILLLVAPWLAALVAWRSGGLFQLDERRNDVKPSLVFLALFPMLALMLRAVLDYQTVGWLPQTVAALFIGTALFVAQRVAHADVRANSLTALVTFLVAFLAYGYGAALHINALAESSDMQQIRYLLREKHISKGNVTTYKVKLDKVHMNAPDVDSAEVTSYFYEMLKTGDSVCLAFRPGALGIKWYSAGPCPPDTP